MLALFCSQAPLTLGYIGPGFVFAIAGSIAALVVAIALLAGGFALYPLLRSRGRARGSDLEQLNEPRQLEA